MFKTEKLTGHDGSYTLEKTDVDEEKISETHIKKRHGWLTTLESQKWRAILGETPDGIFGKPTDSSKFFISDLWQLLLKAKENLHAIDEKGRLHLEADGIIGGGYPKDSEELYVTEHYPLFFDKKGKLISMFPNLSKGRPFKEVDRYLPALRKDPSLLLPVVVKKLD